VGLLAAVLLEPLHDGADERARVLAAVAALGGEADAKGGGETFEVLDPGFVETVSGKIHSRRVS
jgi:hypothetical protein